MKNAKELLSKYHSGEATDEEKALVESWYLRYGTAPSDLTPEQLQEEHDLGLKMLHAQILQQKKLSIWPRVAAAAAVIGCIAAAVHYLSPGKQAPASPVVQTAPDVTEDIPPGGSKAVLTLASGKKISLTDARVGQLAKEQGLSIHKKADGELVYTVEDKSAAAGSYNTITTPAGGQYQVTLPDGSRVWLNAASSLRYPVRFAEQERTVELTGEAYFEVTTQPADKGGKCPFIVQTGGQKVEVLGTHFNINGYNDDASIKTTLLEGAVKVSGNRQPGVLLKPGQMAVTSRLKGTISVNAADINDVMAWKKGYFIFNNENIRDIMIKLARWYDIEVAYEGDMTGVAFQGNYSKTRNLVNLLKTIEQTNSIRFKIEGRRVTVIKQ